MSYHRLLIILLFAQMINLPYMTAATDDPGSAILSFENIHNQTIANLAYSDLDLTSQTSIISFKDVSNLVIQNISIVGVQSTSNQVYGIRFTNAHNITLQNVYLSNFQSISVIGLGVINSSKISILDVSISNFHTFSNMTETTGILIASSSQVSIIDTSVYDLSALGSYRATTYGVSIVGASDVKLQNNSISRLDTRSNIANTFGIHALESSTISFKQQKLTSLSSSLLGRANQSSYSTGFYVALSEDIEISGNLLESVHNVGTAAYGMFIDRSDNLSIETNVVENTRSTGERTNLGTAIVIRTITNGRISSNLIRDIQSDYIGGPNGLSSSVALIADNSHNTSLISNVIEGIHGFSTSTSTDSAGILIGSGSNLLLSHNSIRGMSTLSNGDGITSGIVASSVQQMTIEHNSIAELEGLINYGIFLTSVRNVDTRHNEIHALEGWTVRGQYASLSTNLHISNTSITDLISPVNQGIRFAWVTNGTIADTTIVDSETQRDNAGVVIQGDSSSLISNNSIVNKKHWVVIDPDSEVICESNWVNNTQYDSCSEPPAPDLNQEKPQDREKGNQLPLPSRPNYLDNEIAYDIYNAGTDNFNLDAPLIFIPILLYGWVRRNTRSFL